MIHDSKAEALEARGLYRRAAARWAEVIMLANDDKAREQAAKRRAECIHKAARPPARQDKFGGDARNPQPGTCRDGISSALWCGIREIPKKEQL